MDTKEYILYHCIYMTLKHTANHPEVVGLLWLSSDLHFAFQCRGRGSIPGQGTKNPQAVQCGQNKKKLKIKWSKWVIEIVSWEEYRLGWGTRKSSKYQKCSIFYLGAGKLYLN